MAAPSASLADRALARQAREERTSFQLLPALAVSALAILLISLACVAFVPSVRDFMTGNTLWNGLSGLVTEKGAIMLDDLAGLPPEPAGKTLLTISEVPHDPAGLVALRRWAEEGGRLVVMDDFGQGNQVLEGLGLKLRFSGLTLLDPIFCYQKPELPRLTDLSPELTQRGISALTLNHATTLTGLEGSQVLARSSDQSYVEVPTGNGSQTSRAYGPFAAAARVAVGRGEVYVLSDPSLLINSMAGRDDNRALMVLLAGEGSPGSLYLDTSRLKKGPLDSSKSGLDAARAAFAHPAAATALALFITLAFGLLLLRRNPPADTQNHGGDHLA